MGVKGTRRVKRGWGCFFFYERVEVLLFSLALLGKVMRFSVSRGRFGLLLLWLPRGVSTAIRTCNT